MDILNIYTENNFFNNYLSLICLFLLLVLTYISEFMRIFFIKLQLAFVCGKCVCEDWNII